MGVVTPAGCSLDTFWDALCHGTSTAAPLEGFDTSGHRVRFGCQVDRSPAPGDGIRLLDKEHRRADPVTQFGVRAALAAHADAGAPAPDPARAAVVVGNAVGSRHTDEMETRNYVERGPGRVNPLMPVTTLPNATAASLAIRLGWRGPATTVATACASSADAIGHARLLLQTGATDVALAGGCEAPLTPVSLAGFANLNALSTRNSEPEVACRPFDADRDGLVMGEGAGFIVLERLADARARGRMPYAILAGYGANSDAHHLVMPPDDGAGALQCMSAALDDAGLEAGDIVHVNAHGTSTPQNDRAEGRALQKLFGAGTPPVTGTKGVTGHLIGAAGAVELVAAALALRHETAPPTANHQRLDPDLDIDVVSGTPRPLPAGPVLSSSFGLGGHNACLVVTPA